MLLIAEATTNNTTSKRNATGTAKVEVSQDTSSEESVPKSFGSLYRAPKTTAGEAAVAAEEQRTGAAVGAGGRGRGKGKDVGVDPPSSTADNPNVFFIMIDDMGWNDIGYHSTDLANVTPNLDRLSASGVKVGGLYVNPWEVFVRGRTVGQLTLRPSTLDDVSYVRGTT